MQIINFTDLYNVLHGKPWISENKYNTAKHYLNWPK